MNVKSVKTILRKVERPRPLKVKTDGDTVVSGKKAETDFGNVLQNLYVNLSNSNYDESTAEGITQVCNILQAHGQELDMSMKNMMDHYFVTFRNASREDRLDMTSRLKLLEIIERRAMGWKTNENIIEYYKQKITELEGSDKITSPASQNFPSLLSTVPMQPPVTTISVPLAPGEILRSSGKFAKPTKIAGKNYYKDEVVIRNADSGKVNPGARDRLVQITGPNEEAISHAKTLVEDTIRRNASPMREAVETNVLDAIESKRRKSFVGFEEPQELSRKQLAHSYSMGDATFKEFTQELETDRGSIKISSTDSSILQEAILALKKYFAGDVERKEWNCHERSSLQRAAFTDTTGSMGSSSPLDTPSSEDESYRNGAPAFLKPNLGLDGKFLFPEVAPDNPYILPRSSSISSPAPIPPPEPRSIKYTKAELERFRQSPLCNAVPKMNPEAVEYFPHIFKEANFNH